MKTRILLIVTMCFCLIGGAFAQTNMDLEIWGPTPPLSGSDPTGWGTGNTDQIAGPVSTFQETVNPGQGLSSARMVTTAGYLAIGAPQDIIGGFINSGTSPFLGNMGVPYTQKPTSMDCQFMCNIMPGDTGAVLVQLTHWDGTAQILDGQGIIAFDGTVNAWTPVNVPITYITADTPDTLLIVGISSIEIFFGSPVGIVGSTLYLDDFVLNTGGCPAPTAGFTSTSNLLAATFTDGSTTTGGATYIWDFGDGVGTSTLQNPSYTYLAAGTYNVCLTIVDACGADQICQTITVTGCPTPTAAFSSFDSSLTVIFNDLSTTTGAVTYFWDFGDGFGTSALQNPAYTYATGGTYNACLTVTDNCGTNTSCQSVTVIGGCNLIVTTSSTDETAAGANDGTATATAAGGTPPYTYTWSPGGQNTSTITGLSPGTYTVVVIDVMGCIASGAVTVQPAGGCNLVVTTTSTDETAVGANDGTGTAMATGGTAPYNYLWNDSASQTTAVATGLSPGSYTVTVTDAGGCQVTGNIVVQPGGVVCNLVVTVTSTDETTVGANDGTATATVSNGAAPYTYSWTPGGQTTSSITGLAPGTYTVVVIDALGCQAVGTAVIAPGGGACNLVVSASSTDESSAGMNDGTGTAFASNGTTPYVYLWSGGQTTAQVTGLAPGTYTVTVTDANACVATASITILAGAVNCQVQITITVTNETSVGASDGTATAVVTMGTQPYAYLWSTGATTASISGLAPGVYSCTVLDADGCTIAGTGVVQSFQCTLSGSTSSTDETSLGAFDGSATVTASGGTAPYTYLWNTLETTSTISNLVSGIYSVTVTDANGCTYSTAVAVNIVGCGLTASVNGNDETQAGANDGSATVTIAGGTPPYIINWDNGGTTSTISNLAPGNYTVTVIDSATGCLATATYTVVPGQIISIFEQPVPVITVKVYPNPAVDMINFEITGADHVMLYVYDFAGRQVKEIAIDEPIEKVDASDLVNGMYFYQLVGAGNDKLESGKFVILK